MSEKPAKMKTFAIGLARIVFYAFSAVFCWREMIEGSVKLLSGVALLLTICLALLFMKDVFRGAFPKKYAASSN